MNERVALLNERQDGKVASQLIALARRHLDALDEKLTTTELDRDEYLRTISRRHALRAVLSEQQRIYDSNFKV